MVYRNGTYISFHAEGTNAPTDSDIKYYNLLKAWKVREESDFHFVNSHEKTSAVRDTSKRDTLRRTLIARLRQSKNMILIIGETTKEDTDWIPFEIIYAVDKCEIPIIAAYPGMAPILSPGYLSYLWPSALAKRINDGSARVIHVPFREEPLRAAVSKFDHTNLPKGPLTYYIREVYKGWGLL